MEHFNECMSLSLYRSGNSWENLQPHLSDRPCPDDDLAQPVPWPLWGDPQPCQVCQERHLLLCSIDAFKPDEMMSMVSNIDVFWLCFSMVPSKVLCEGAEVSKFKTKAFIQALLKKSDLAKVCGDLNRLLRASIRLITLLLGSTTVYWGYRQSLNRYILFLS